MWTAFKALGIGVKIGILITFLAMISSIAAISYNKGLNVSKVAISQYETKVQKLNADLATAQGKIDVRTVTEYRDRIEYIDRVQTKTRTIIEKSVPEQFHLSKGWVYTYNQSTQGLEIDPVLAADPTPSTISEMRALANTIVPNNGKYLSVSAQLIALQKWILDSEAARAEITHEK